MTLRFLDHLSPSRRAGYLVGVLVMALTLAPAVVPAMIPKASAACRDAEVVFARGRQESPGAGILGNAFVSALRSKVNKNVGLYAVQYPADTEVAVGANDMSAHVQSVINSCPDTRMVLGGYSLGAAVTDVVMAAPGAMFGFTNPLPPGADQHIAAVALFGNGTQVGGADRELQPGLCRPDHRPVPRRRPDLQPGRPAHLAGQLVAAHGPRLHPGRRGQSGGRLRRRQTGLAAFASRPSGRAQRS